MIRLLIVDDDVLIRESLKFILGTFEDIEVVGIAADGKECIDAIENGGIDMILLDMRMPVMTGIEVLKYIKEEEIRVISLVLTTFDEDELISGALANGAAGYILKNSTPDKIVSAIRSVVAGNGAFESAMVQRMGEQSKKEQVNLSSYALSKREIEVVELISDGLSNKEISETLYISEGTAKNYISSVLTKMNLKHRTQIAITYLKHKYD